MTRSRIFVISLPRARVRRLNVLAQLLPTGWDFEMVDAVDALEVKAEYLKSSPTGWAITMAQVACYRSHLGILQRVCDYDLDYAVILEDDCVLKEAAGLSLGNLIQRLPPEADHVMLHQRRDLFKELRVLEVGEQFNRIGPTNVGTWGYVVSRRFAAHVVRHHAQPAHPIDHLYVTLSRRNEAGFGFYETSGCLVDVLNDESNINGSPPAKRNWWSPFGKRSTGPGG